MQRGCRGRAGGGLWRPRRVVTHAYLPPGVNWNQALVGDYSQRSVLPTPMRTPRTASGSDVILQEARNQLAMINSQTPLLGGQNPTLEEGTGFQGVTPKSSKVRKLLAMTLLQGHCH